MTPIYDFYVAFPLDDEDRYEALCGLEAIRCCDIDDGSELERRLSETLRVRNPAIEDRADTMALYTYVVGFDDIADATVFRLTWADYAVPLMSLAEALAAIEAREVAA